MVKNTKPVVEIIMDEMYNDDQWVYFFSVKMMKYKFKTYILSSAIVKISLTDDKEDETIYLVESNKTIH